MLAPGRSLMTSFSHYSHHARLSELSRRVIYAAQHLATTFDHAEVGLGHLLLILAQETRSPTARILMECGLDKNRLHNGLAQGDPALLVTIEIVLEQVGEVASSAGSHYTGTEHLLLSLLLDPAGSIILERYGVKTEALHQLLT